MGIVRQDEVPNSARKASRQKDARRSGSGHLEDLQNPWQEGGAEENDKDGAASESASEAVGRAGDSAARSTASDFEHTQKLRDLACLESARVEAMLMRCTRRVLCSELN